MFSKRTRLYTNFNLLNFFQIIKFFFFRKKSFHNQLQNHLGTKNISLTSLGRTALYEIVKIIIKKSNKKKFFIAPYTIPAVIHAIKYAGGEVVYIDLDKSTGLISEEKLEKKIDNNSAGVIITHLYSTSNHIEKFLSRFKNKITIIEDAAINFGAKSNNKYLGTLADYGFFSFNVVKNLNTLNGGAIYIKDNQLFDEYVSEKKYEKFPIINTINLLLTILILKFFFNNFVYQFFHYFLVLVYKKKINFILKKIYPILYHNYERIIPKSYSYDFNWIMNDVGVYNLKKVKTDYLDRRDKAMLYSQLISDQVATKFDCFSEDNALLEYTIVLKNTDNQKAHAKLMEEGYDIRHTWYINNHLIDGNDDKTNFKDTYFVETKIFCLPVHKNISKKDIQKISNIINTFI